LAIRLRGCAERLVRLLREQRAELFPGVDERRQIVDDSGDLAYRALRVAAAVAQDLFGDRQELPELDHGRSFQTPSTGTPAAAARARMSVAWRGVTGVTMYPSRPSPTVSERLPAHAR